ncbi:J domain-containing protein [Halosegnis sp.]|uniref:J domain-containing protein n=1 Tax=Halosegnis sp. TaxID=2864959 RepID=UPI0035D4B76E
MVHEVVVQLPTWLLWGVALGVLGSLIAAGVFLVGVRLFPTEPPDAGDQLDGDGRRRGEIRAYLEGLGESFTENAAIDGQRVAFYLPKRDVAITFNPRAFYRIERSPTHAVLVEHEMPAELLGYRLPFETPEPESDSGPDTERQTTLGRAAAETGDPRAAALATLGLPSGASREEVRAAYRERVKEVHPDHGGDEEEFKRLQEAYTTARREANA